MVAVAVMTAVSIQAQRLRLIDTEGAPVSYASVMTPDAVYVGITDLDGVLADLKGNTNVVVSHVAYKTQNVKINGEETVATLEDADFGLNEITVSPKPLVYVQTYYRMYFYSDKDGMVYYRVGLTDNVYDTVKKKVTASTDHKAKAKMGIVKTILGMMGSLFDRASHIREKKLEDRMQEWGKATKIKITEEGPGRKRISDFKGTVGYITDDKKDGLRRFTYNNSLMYNHRLEAEGKEKELQKRAKREEKEKNKQESNYYLYRINEDGSYAPEDFVMRENMDSWDEEKDGEMVHYIICIQVFTTDRSYVTKNELKQRKKDNKMKLDYNNIQQFERSHRIPALPAAVQKKLNEVWKVGE